MDVERIQKINNLALELMKQGLAANREEAVIDAEKVFRNKDSEVYSSMRETLVKVEAAKEEAREPRRTEGNMVGSLSEDKIAQILEKNTAYLVKKITEFSDKVAALEKELSSIKTKLTYQSLPTVNDIRSKGVSVPPVQAKEDAPRSSHPRSGNYNENDVSIEKFFYMGK
ncbi:MAG TPA: hypothetical protein VJC39_04355 [Candidatus Nanoarchaeia archaeon]|nr:hypothetical protein [Candidatus Nanoarchaeia archaeon]